MKKYLMSGVAAIAFLAAFTSCSKTTDLYEEGRKEKDQAEQKAKTTLETFNEAFVETFGTPDPNHHWGFDKPASTRTISNGVFTPTHLSSTSSWNGWVSAPADADFATAVPSDAEFLSEYYRLGAAWPTSIHANYKLLDQETEQKVEPYKGNADIYVDGKKTISFTNPGDGSPAVNFHILPNANVTFKGNFNYQRGQAFAMYIDATATVTFEGDLSANVFIFNRGNVTVKGITGPYADGGIYNDGGTFTCQKSLSVFNEGSQVINNGTITVAEGVTVEGSGHFRNADEGKITVTGLTFVNSNNCSWINDGEYTTDNFTYHAGSTDVINNCMLKVNSKFLINLGDTEDNCFLMNGGAGVETGSFHFAGPGYIYMGSGSVFKVLGDATLDATKVHYGIYGPASGSPAVFHVVGNITTSNTAQAYDITYGNNIAVVASTHFDSENNYESKSGQYPIIDFVNCTKDVIYTGGAKPAIKITSGKCNPGFEGGEEQYDGRIMAEDLNATEASDFDYNDVVFDYKIDVAARKAKIKLRAAGGIYPLTVGGVEVHAKFGFSDSYPMINTGDGVTATAEAYEYEFPTGVDPSAENIPVIVTKEGIPYTLGAPTGEAAAKFCVVTTCKWMKERKFISDAYDKFDDWVRNHTVTWTTSIKDANLLYNE